MNEYTAAYAAALAAYQQQQHGPTPPGPFNPDPRAFAPFQYDPITASMLAASGFVGANPYGPPHAPMNMLAMSGPSPVNPNASLNSSSGPEPPVSSQHVSVGVNSSNSNNARRKNATRETTATLKAWLYEHRKNPYPTKGEKIMLAIITKMSLNQVSTWFANARRRLKKENKMSFSPKNGSGSNNKSADDFDSDLDDMMLMPGQGKASGKAKSGQSGAKISGSMSSDNMNMDDLDDLDDINDEELEGDAEDDDDLDNDDDENANNNNNGSFNDPRHG